MAAKGAHIGVRLDEALLARVDAMIDRLSTEWHEAKRSDVVRMLITWSLTRLESDAEEMRKLIPPASGAEEERGDHGEA